MKLVSACRLFVATMLLCSTVMLSGQSDCSTFAYVLGNAGDNARGYSIAADPLNAVIYVAGVKRDSAVIVQMGLNGELHWVRTFDVVPGRADHISEIILDSDGMLVFVGTAGDYNNGATRGNVFIVKYNVEANTIVWSREVRNPSQNVSFGVTEMGPGGHYLMCNYLIFPNDAELIVFDRNTGSPIANFSKHYSLGTSQSMNGFKFYNDKLYATARFTDGSSVAGMRHTLMRLNPDNGLIEWIRLGHRSSVDVARLYGFDMIIHDDHIISFGSGDDVGSSTNNTKLYLYKHTLDGSLVWAIEYDIPGVNDWAEQIRWSNNGYLLFARNRITTGDITLMKVDLNGTVIWAKQYDFSPNDNFPHHNGNASMCAEVMDHYYFTAFAQTGSAYRMVVVKTDLNGDVDSECTNVREIVVNVRVVADPVFYPVQPMVFNSNSQVLNVAAQGSRASTLARNIVCNVDTISEVVVASICFGQDFEGYTLEGEYTDYFISASGCDSIRVLHLEVGNHEAYVEITICAGSSFESYTSSGIYLDTLAGEAGACDTLRTLALTVQPPVMVTINHMMCEGETYMGHASAGTYTDTLTTAMGCDSIRVLNLAVELQEVFVVAEICAGESLYGYTHQGIYTDTVPGLQGACDTVRTLHLLVHDAAETFYAVGICEGESVYGYSTQGIHIDTLAAANGCDSIRTLDLTVSSATPPVPLNVSACDNPFGFTQPGEYIDTLIAESGCDSIVLVSVSGVARYIPNVFSPNGDGVNDNFEVLVPSYDVMELEHFAIFDRFGGMVYDTRQWPVRWDGRGVEGQVFNPGVSAWVFIYICNGRRVIESGDVSLLR